MRTRKTTRRSRRTAEIKGRFTVLKLRRQNWCRHIQEERSADLWRTFTGRLFNRARARATNLREQTTRRGRDSRHYGRLEPDSCRRREMRRAKKPMYSRTIV